MEQHSEKEHPPAYHEVAVSAQPKDTPEDAGILNKSYRKVDCRLLTWYAFVFLLMKIESHNITNAAIINIEVSTLEYIPPYEANFKSRLTRIHRLEQEGADIKHQLGDLSSEQWAMILSIFDYPHIIFEPISTLLVKKLSPRTWLSRIIISWGIISMCQSAAASFGALMACRALLGLAEAGFLPGVLYHLSFWFPAERLPMRIAFLCAFAQLAGSVSGVLAFGISYLNGRLGLAGWQYLFILEGAPAVLCGILTLLFLPNFPDGVKFLTDQEKSAILRSLPPTQPRSDETSWSWNQAKSFLKDLTTYSFLMVWVRNHPIQETLVLH
jgi:MFS family permease